MLPGSDNDSPKIFRDDQQYLILELNHGGEDLESFTFNNSQQALSVFNQVRNSLLMYHVLTFKPLSTARRGSFATACYAAAVDLP